MLTPEVGCRAVEVNICFEQGSAFDPVFTWKAGGVPVDLTGYTARAQVRKDLGEVTEAIVIDMNTGNGRIVLGGVAGTITFCVTATDTAALLEDDFDNTCYDLEMIPPAPNAEKVRKLTKGLARLELEKTK